MTIDRFYQQSRGVQNRKVIAKPQFRSADLRDHRVGIERAAPEILRRPLDDEKFTIEYDGRLHGVSISLLTSRWPFYHVAWMSGRTAAISGIALRADKVARMSLRLSGLLALAFCLARLSLLFLFVHIKIIQSDSKFFPCRVFKGLAIRAKQLRRGIQCYGKFRDQ
jgi:hypothetical protein